MKKFVEKNGFSLVQVIVTMGLIGGLALISTVMMKNMTKNTVKSQVDSDILLATNEINAILSDPTNCKATVPTTTSPISFIDFKGTHKFPTGIPFGNSNQTINSYALGTYDPTNKSLVLSVNFDKKQILGGTGFISKKIDLYVEVDTDGTTTKVCRSLSSSTVDIWSHGTGSDIYYSGGSVGIGTTNPGSKLEVNGDVKITGSLYTTILYQPSGAAIGTYNFGTATSLPDGTPFTDGTYQVLAEIWNGGASNNETYSGLYLIQKRSGQTRLRVILPSDSPVGNANYGEITALATVNPTISLTWGGNRSGRLSILKMSN